ncbi:hypothetical protein ACVMB0_006825 [Bradyrhizobium sp. USDA 4451]
MKAAHASANAPAIQSVTIAIMPAPADRALQDGCGLGAGFRHDLVRNQRKRKPDAERQQDQVVEIAEHRDEIRYQVDRRERIGRNGDRKGLCVPRYAWIARC